MQTEDHLTGAFVKQKMSRLTLKDVWSRDSVDIEFSPLLMLSYQFKLSPRALWFDDINKREERKVIDRLALIRDLFEQFLQLSEVSAFVTVCKLNSGQNVGRFFWLLWY